MRSILAAIPIVVMLSPYARADWEYTRWGMTPEQVVKASGGHVKLLQGAEQRTVAPDMRHEAEGTYSDGSVSLQVRFTFDPTNGNGLNCVFYAVTDEKQAPALKDLMIKRYGQPSKQGGIAVLGMTDLTWEKPDDINLTISNSDPAFVTHCKKK
ncbi:MAG: hypothetical protein JWL84_2463 [Rhodospirillales bacterium]|jgi:hypothetical protein|nr:hypothetical protein [Rhodospirillales bacterium]